MNLKNKVEVSQADIDAAVALVKESLTNKRTQKDLVAFVKDMLGVSARNAEGFVKGCKMELEYQKK